MENNNKHDVIDVEVVNREPGDGQNDSSRTRYTASSYSSYQSGSGNGPTVTFFSMAGTGAPGHQGLPLASFITFFLFFACLFKWGFLAALGFAFFYAIGAAAGIYHNMRTVLQGRLPNPWFWRAGNWIVSLALVAWMV